MRFSISCSCHPRLQCQGAHLGHWCKPLPCTIAVERSDLCELDLHRHHVMLVDKVVNKTLQRTHPSTAKGSVRYRDGHLDAEYRQVRQASLG